MVPLLTPRWWPSLCYMISGCPADENPYFRDPLVCWPPKYFSRGAWDTYHTQSCCMEADVQSALGEKYSGHRSKPASDTLFIGDKSDAVQIPSSKSDIDILSQGKPDNSSATNMNTTIARRSIQQGPLLTQQAPGIVKVPYTSDQVTWTTAHYTPICNWAGPMMIGIIVIFLLLWAFFEFPNGMPKREGDGEEKALKGKRSRKSRNRDDAPVVEVLEWEKVDGRMHSRASTPTPSTVL